MDSFGYVGKKAAVSRHHGGASRGDADMAMIDDTGSARMSWLYRMISNVHMSGDGSYSDYSRSWLARRVDNSDGGASRDRKASEWWEHDPVPIKDQFLQMPANDTEISRARPSTAIPQLKLQEVLNTPAFLGDFKSYLEDIYCPQYLNFLEAHKSWLELDPKADPKRYIRQAKHIYEQFVDAGAEEMVALPQDVRTKAAATTGGAYQKLRNDTDLAVIAAGIRPAFDEVRRLVIAHVESALFPRFLKSDEYQEMLAVRFEEDSASVGAAAAYKGLAWDNAEGFKSLHVELQDGSDVGESRKVWCQLTVDLRTYKSEAKAPVAAGAATPAPADPESKSADTSEAKRTVTWQEHFQFPIASTTQNVRVSVYTSGLIDSSVFLGRAFVPIGAIHERQVAGDFSPLVVKLLPRAYGEKVTGELRMVLKLSKDEAKDDRKPIQDDDNTSSMITDGIRGLVSKKKKRFREDGFDLDLSYITDRIIAMGFPSEGFEGVFRNKMEDVQRMLEKRHPICYKVYNLCSERSYDPVKFKGRVCRFPFDDHNPPSVEQIKEFCVDSHRWLEKHPQNVIAVHCKAGKGRTGTMIASYFVYARLCPDARSALKFFGMRRTQNGKGVTIPSQKRYVYYFEHYCTRRRMRLDPPPKASLFLKEIIMHEAPGKLSTGDIWFFITQNNRRALRYSSKNHIGVRRKKLDKVAGQKKTFYRIWFDFDRKPILLTDDINMEFQHETAFGSEKLFQYWFNTRYVVSLAAAHHTEDLAKAPQTPVVPEEPDDGKDVEESEQENSVIVSQTPGDDDDDEEDDGLPEDDESPPEVMLGHFHTSASQFGEQFLHLTFEKKAVDKICKDKKNKKYPANFKVELKFVLSSVTTSRAVMAAMQPDRPVTAADPALLPGSVTPGGPDDHDAPASSAAAQASVAAVAGAISPRSGSSAGVDPKKADASKPAAGAAGVKDPKMEFKIGKLMTVKL